tara:strand:+ start:5220 stop:5756 length:537 start_codon:yes stop_codon:yes gene_type:complete
MALSLASRVITVAMLSMSWAVNIASASDAETRVALMVNFARYAEWPAGKSPDDRGEWNLCSDPSDPDIAAALKSIDGEALYDQNIHIRILRPDEDITDCHLLYLSSLNDEAEVRQRIEAAHGQPTLTVSDYEDFARMGGMIELVIDDGRYKFDVDYSRVLQSHLRLSSSMLKLARRVR